MIALPLLSLLSRFYTWERCCLKILQHFETAKNFEWVCRQTQIM